jgi:hypothetical protein
MDTYASYFNAEDARSHFSESLQHSPFTHSANIKNRVNVNIKHLQWRIQEFCSGGVQQIQLRTEGRENGDLGR